MVIQERNTTTTVLTLDIVANDFTTGIYIPDATLGQLFIQIRKADTTAVGKGNYDYVIKEINPSGYERPWMHGAITFGEIG